MLQSLHSLLIDEGQAVTTTSSFRPMDAPADIVRIRELYLARATDDLSGVRPVVARSWHRSRAAGVDPTIDRGVFDLGRVDDNTLDAASVHLRSLDELAADLGGYVSLTAPNGTLVRASFLRDFDEFPTGYSLLEESCGTNGEGLALEEGRGVWLAPEEHYREDMRGNWCFATLIRDPFHRRVRGVIGLTLPAVSVSSLDPASTLLMLESVSAKVESEIALRTASREQTLLHEYLTVSRRRGNAMVLAVDGKNAFMNDRAVRALDEHDLSVVLGYAAEVMSDGRQRKQTVTLKGAGLAQLEVAPVRTDGRDIGAIVVLKPERARASRLEHGIPAGAPDVARQAMSALQQRLDGASAEFGRMISQVSDALDRDRSLAILGEEGTGKSRLARAAAETVGQYLVFDAAESGLHDPRAGEALRRAHSEDLRIVLIENADELSMRDAESVVAYLRRNSSLRVILTAVRPTPSSQAIAVAAGAVELTIEPLRNRREDIPVIAAAICREIGSKPLSRQALTALIGADWPRNADQLRSVINDAASRSRGPELSVDDLPLGFRVQSSASRLSRLEEAELSEIRRALRETGGNRRSAAAMLQIGRSTLYRRMDYFRSRGFAL